MEQCWGLNCLEFPIKYLFSVVIDCVLNKKGVKKRKMLTQILHGFQILFTLNIFIYLIGGLLMGIFFGSVPGLTATLAIALLLPFTFTMKTIPALVTIMGIYAGGIFGGCLTAITINIPGAPASTMTMIEGYEMMKKGKGASAIGHAAIASGIGGMIGALILMFVAPQMMKVALAFKSPERFSLIVVALIMVATVTRGSLLKGIISTLIGLAIATIGLDPLIPTPRFHFGIPYLMRGVGLLPAVTGLFAISELLRQMEFKQWDIKLAQKIKISNFIPSWSEIKKIGPFLYLKSAVIGNFVGILPGGGASMAAFMAYGEAKRSSRYPEKFGTGIPEGIIAAESANNAMCGGALVPLLSLGIPGDAVTAIIFGVLLIQGMIPGPQLIVEHSGLIGTMFAALFTAQMLIPLVTFLLTPVYLRITNLNRGLIFSFIAVIALVGTYVAEFSAFQMGLAVVMGVLAYFMQRAGYPIVPVLMGFILGPYLELFFRRSLTLGKGVAIFFTSPISAVLLLLAGLFLYILGVKRPHLEENNSKS